MVEAPSKGKTVLVVDDDTQAVDILCRLLDLRGYRSLRAMSGRECLDVVGRETIDVIVLDVMMPEMDGIGVLKALGVDDATRSIPVILLTGKDDYETRSAGMRLGVSEFLAKPVNKQQLYSRIEAQLRGRDLARQIDETIAKIPRDP